MTKRTFWLMIGVIVAIWIVAGVLAAVHLGK